MTVKQLIDKLKTFPPNFEVWLSKDSEGNGFDTLYTIETAHMKNFVNDDSPNYESPHDSVILWP